jgi:hypothetical protein
MLHETAGGPRFVLIRIGSGHVARSLPPRDGVFLKTRFRAELGFQVS